MIDCCEDLLMYEAIYLILVVSYSLSVVLISLELGNLELSCLGLCSLGLDTSLLWMLCFN